jgi:SAM-dependent MidA family methyltransferase
MEARSRNLDRRFNDSTIYLSRRSFNIGGTIQRMTAGNPALIDIIQTEIRKRGHVSFAWFMEQALYHPEHGYYSSGRASIGRRGDYFTNVSVGPLFGQLLAAQFAQIWQRLGQIDNFIIVEQGAHHGDFARDVLEAVRKIQPEFFEALRYRIVEPFPVLQDRQSKTLVEFGERVQWKKSLGELEPFTGAHFSNELLDAVPADLRGKLVGLEEDKLVFIERPPDKAAQINRAALDWIDHLSTKLERGFVIAIDYGFARDEFREVLQVRTQHRLLDSPFEQIGEADLTMHINWTELAERAESRGLRVAGFTDQHHFVTGIISELGRGGSPEPPAGDWGQSPLPSLKARRALQTLVHPEMLGRAFQVLALSKDVDSSTPLAGFKFARESRSALGI